MLPSQSNPANLHLLSSSLFESFWGKSFFYLAQQMLPFTGILKIRVMKGRNLIARDVMSADPYVLFSIGDHKVKTSVVRGSLNPVWEDNLTLVTSEPLLPLKLFVFDKDTFTKHDEMGEAEVSLIPLLGAVKLNERLGANPENILISRVVATKENGLARDSTISFRNGNIVQELSVKLLNVETGEIDLELMWQPYGG